MPNAQAEKFKAHLAAAFYSRYLKLFWVKSTLIPLSRERVKLVFSSSYDIH